MNLFGFVLVSKQHYEDLVKVNRDTVTILSEQVKTKSQQLEHIDNFVHAMPEAHKQEILGVIKDYLDSRDVSIAPPVPAFADTKPSQHEIERAKRQGKDEAYWSIAEALQELYRNEVKLLRDATENSSITQEAYLHTVEAKIREAFIAWSGRNLR